MAAANTTANIVFNDNPPQHAFAVVPSDTVDLPFVTRFIYVGGAGDVSLITLGGETVVFKAVPVGTTLKVQATRVTSTNTTATNLLGEY